MTLYDRIGEGYAARRREDPQIKARLVEALGGAQSVVNVGAGAGSYEPEDRTVIAVEPSEVMAAQRPRHHPAVEGFAEALPLHDASVDAAMTVLSAHHWHPRQRAGIREMCRVARDTVVVLTIDAWVSGAMWLMADYLTEVRDLDHKIFPDPRQIAEWMDRPARVHVVPVPRDTPDHMLLSFWAHPERVLDPAARAATSGFARQPRVVVDRVVEDVGRDIVSGAWDAKYGGLRELRAFDAGLRLVVGRASREE